MNTKQVAPFSASLILNSPPIRIFMYLALLVAVFCTATEAAFAKRVLVLPFQINAAEDLTFLQKGIQDMLSTRLAYEDKVVVIGIETLKDYRVTFRLDPVIS